MFDDVPDAVVVVDQHGIVRYANRACETVFGYGPEDFVGMQHDVVIPESARDLHIRHVAAFAADPQSRPMAAGMELQAQRRDGSTVPVEIALVPLRDHPGMVAAFARDASIRQALLDRIRAKDEVITALVGGVPRERWLEIGVRRGRDLLGANLGWISLVDEDETMLEIVAADGADALLLRGERIPVAASWVSSDASGDWVVVDDAHTDGDPFTQVLELDVGPLVVLPMRRKDGSFAGASAFGRRHGSSSFTKSELSIAAKIVQVLVDALELSEARAKAGHLAILDDHDRIARDLHDSIIQDLFAIGLRLEAAATQQPAGKGAGRMQEAVDSIDDVIQGIRTVIFDLHSPATAQGGLRKGILELVEDTRETLGFLPRVGLTGPIDTFVDDTVAQNLLTVLHETLSNVVRHAHATEVDVMIDVAEEVTLTVVDDGEGFPGDPSAGHGLTNLRARAEALGGSFSIEPRTVGGSIVCWRVPLEISEPQ